MSLDMPITFMGSNGDGPRKLLAVDNIVIRTMRNDSIALGMEPETDLREASLKPQLNPKIRICCGCSLWMILHSGLIRLIKPRSF